MMTRMVAESVVTPSSSIDDLSPGIPASLYKYACAFLTTARDSIRFLWRDESRWLAVHLVRSMGGPKDSSVRWPSGGTDHASVRVVEIDLPRGVTVREIEVLTLLSLGLTNTGIADRLGTSPRTVSTQIERLLMKLDQKTRGGLAALAVDTGLVTLPIPGGMIAEQGIGIVELEAATHAPPTRHVDPIRPAYPRKRPLLVGSLIPIGAATADGIEVLQGARLAVEEVNARGGVGGRPLELVTADIDIFNGQSVQRGVERLFASDVDAITTSYVSSEQAGLIDLVADYRRPFLHTATFAEQVANVESDPTRYGSIIQTCDSETYYGLGLVRLLSDLVDSGRWTPRSRRIISIEAESSSTRVTTEEFRARAELSGWFVQDTVRVPIRGADWESIVRIVVDLEPEVIMMTHFLNDEVAAFHRAFRAAEFPALLYYVYGPSIPGFVDSLGSQTDGVIWSTTTGTYDDDLGRRFRRDFATRFGRLPGWSQAGAAYDQINLLASAWASSNSRDPSVVMQHLRRIPFRGVNGVYYFGPRAQAARAYPDRTLDASISQAMMVYQIQGGEHRPLAPEPFGSVDRFQVPPWCSDWRVA
ncbi:MAG: ABC transporter substrate-binding protein [Microbacteriaceae bacterium]